MRKGVLEQSSSVLLQEDRVGHIRVWYRCWIEQWNPDRPCLHELEQPCKDHTLEFESALVVRIRQHEEDVLHDTQEILLEELIRHLGICGGKVVDNLQAHWETGVSMDRGHPRTRKMDGLRFSAISAISLMVCFIPQTMLSMNSLNWADGRVKSAIWDMSAPRQ